MITGILISSALVIRYLCLSVALSAMTVHEIFLHVPKMLYSRLLRHDVAKQGCVYWGLFYCFLRASPFCWELLSITPITWEILPCIGYFCWLSTCLMYHSGPTDTHDGSRRNKKKKWCVFLSCPYNLLMLLCTLTFIIALPTVAQNTLVMFLQTRGVSLAYRTYALTAAIRQLPITALRTWSCQRRLITIGAFRL